MGGDSILLEIWLGWIFVCFEDLVWFSYNGLAIRLHLAVLCCRFGLVWRTGCAAMGWGGDLVGMDIWPNGIGLGMDRFCWAGDWVGFGWQFSWVGNSVGLDIWFR